MDITTHTAGDDLSVYGSDDFARIAAGAIGWTGIFWNNWSDRQSRSYSPGSKWSPAKVVTTRDVEDLLMRFTIGAVAAFDDHGIRYNIPAQTVVPSQGQQLDVDWPYIFGILGGICFIQFFALCLLISFANRTAVSTPIFVESARTIVRRAQPMIARLVAASSRSGVVRPCSAVRPFVATNATSGVA